MESVTEPHKKIAVQKPNPNCRENYFNGSFNLSKYKPWSEYESNKWDKVQQSLGWEWMESEEKQSKTIYFPEELSYQFFPSHPEY